MGLAARYKILVNDSSRSRILVLKQLNIESQEMKNLADHQEHNVALVVTPVRPTESSGACIWTRATSRSTKNFAVLAVATLLLAGVPGCGSGKPSWEHVFTTTGSLTFNGQPIEGAVLVFTPKDESIPSTVRPMARTDASGHFEVGTYDIADGAPEGDYDVVVTWTPLVKHAGGASPGPNRLPPRYASTATSKLTVHINSDDTQLETLALTR